MQAPSGKVRVIVDIIEGQGVMKVLDQGVTQEIVDGMRELRSVTRQGILSMRGKNEGWIHE